MSEKKIIAVVGATGAQGSGLVRAICEDPQSEFVARVLTRDPNSAKARVFTELGAEVVACDIDDQDSLNRAFAGCYGAYCVTFFWDHFDVDREQRQAEMMAQAARTNGLKHVVWSTLEDTRKWVPLESDQMPTLQGKYKVPHFDGKGEADQYFRDAGVPTTFLLTSFYWDNFIHFGMGPQVGPDGKLAITLPMDNAKLPGIAAEDIGRCAYGVFKAGDQFIGKTVGISGEHLTGSEMAAGLSKALGKEITYNAVPPDVYRSFGFPGADDVGNMFQFKRDFEKDFTAARSVEFSRSLNGDLQDFAAWAEKHRSEIPLP